MKKIFAVILSVVLILAAVPIAVLAAAPVLENGIFYDSAVTRAESGFDMQSASKCEYFCANGIPITITDRTDGVKGSVITWVYNGTTYTKTLTQNAIVCGGAWDTPVASTSITMTGGTIRYGLFGGGVKEGADVGTPEAPGTIEVNIDNSSFSDGIVGGGIRADVYGDITLTVGGNAMVADNVIGGGFYGDVTGDIAVHLNGGSYGMNVTQTFICGAGVFGNVIGNVKMVIDGANVNGSVGGGSMISGLVTGNVEVIMNSGEVMDVIGGGIGYFSNSFGGSTVTGDTVVKVNGGKVEDIVAGGALGADCHVDGNTQVIIAGGEIGGTSAGHTRNVFGGSVEGDVTGDTKVIIDGGTFVNSIVGGAREGSVGGNVEIAINNGDIGGSVIGGAETGDVTGSVMVILSGGSIAGDVIGGANEGNVSGSVQLGIIGASVSGNVYAGSLVSGDVATADNAEIVVVADPEAITGEIFNGTANSRQFDPETDVINADEHDMTEWTIVIEPTCHTEGLERRDCTHLGCGHSELRAVAMLEHTYGEWTVTKAATCYTDGEKTHECTNEVCTYSETATVTKLEHVLGEWTVFKGAKFAESGIKVRYCTQDGCDYSESDTIPASGFSSLTTFLEELVNALTNFFETIAALFR